MRKLRPDSDLDIIREVEHLRSMYLRDVRAGREVVGVVSNEDMTRDALSLGRVKYVSTYPADDEEPEVSASYDLSFYGEEYFDVNDG